MSEGCFKNSIKNLVEVYIPEEFEATDSQIEIPPGSEWHVVFQDPSGVLDIYGCSAVEESYFLDIMDEEFLDFLTLLGNFGPDFAAQFDDAHFKLVWRQWGP